MNYTAKEQQPPVFTTSGLTSAMQLVNVTPDNRVIIHDTTSAVSLSLEKAQIGEKGQIILK